MPTWYHTSPLDVIAAALRVTLRSLRCAELKSAASMLPPPILIFDTALSSPITSPPDDLLFIVIFRYFCCCHASMPSAAISCRYCFDAADAMSLLPPQLPIFLSCHAARMMPRCRDMPPCADAFALFFMIRAMLFMLHIATDAVTIADIFHFRRLSLLRFAAPRLLIYF